MRTTTGCTAETPRRRRPRRPEVRQRRRRAHYRRQIDQAPTPALMISAALDYLRVILRLVGDRPAAWAVATQLSQAIVRAADGLADDVTERGDSR